MVFDRLPTADAAWLGVRNLFVPNVFVLRGREIGWVGPLSVAPVAMGRTDVDGVLRPGVTDHHGHAARIEPERLLAAGVTTVMDLGWAPEARPLVNRSRHDP